MIRIGIGLGVREAARASWLASALLIMLAGVAVSTNADQLGGPNAVTEVPNSSSPTVWQRRAEILRLLREGHIKQAENAAWNLFGDQISAYGYFSEPAINSRTLLTDVMLQRLVAQPPSPEALSITEHALDLEASLGPQHPDFAASLYKLAVYLIDAKVGGSRPILERALAIQESTLEPDDPGLAASMNTLAELLLSSNFHPNSGDDDNYARELLERAVQNREDSLGGEHLDVAASLYNLGVVFTRLEESPQAVTVLERCLSIREKVLGPEHLVVSETLIALANHYPQLGQYANAQRALERALTILENQLSPDDPLISQTRLSLADVMFEQNDVASAAKLYALSIDDVRYRVAADFPQATLTFENIALVMPKDADVPVQYKLYQPAFYFEYELTANEDDLDPVYARLTRSLNQLAALTIQEANWLRVDIYRAALPYLRRNLEIREKLLGADHPNLAGTLNNLALVLMTQDEYDDAEAMLDRALAIREKYLRPDHPLVANVHNNRAVLAMFRFEYDTARVNQERALDLWSQTYGAEHPIVVNSSLAVAAMLERMRAYEEALQYLQRGASHLQTGNLPATRQKRGRTLISFARYTGRFDEPIKAGPLYKEGLALIESEFGPDDPMLAMALGFYGDHLTELGNYTDAWSVHQRAVGIWERVEGWAPVVLGASLNDLAATLVIVGEMHQARERYAQAIAAMASMREQNPVLAESLANLAALTAADGDPVGALDMALESEQIDRDAFRILARTDTEQRALRQAMTRSVSLDLALSLALNPLIQSPATIRKVWDVVIRNRAVIIDELAARQRAVSVSDDPEITELAEDFVVARTELANLVIRGPGEKSHERYQWFKAIARWEKERTERALASRSARRIDSDGHISWDQEFAHTALGYHEVAKAIPEGTVLVAYTRYDQAPRGNTSHSASNTNRREANYLAFVATAEHNDPAMLELGDAQHIESLIAELREQLANESLDPGRSIRSESAYRNTGHKLRELVWDPLAPHLENAERVYVVMDGALLVLNLTALPIGDTEYLIDTGPQIHYLSTERDLVPETREPLGSGLLVLGNPDFESTVIADEEDDKNTTPIMSAKADVFRGRRAVCAELEDLNFDPLPATAAEIDHIATQWRLRDHSEGVTQLSGARASEAAFKNEAPGKRVLHLATHGFFADERCPSAFEAMMADLDIRPGDISDENPLLLTGLALSGANQRQQADPDHEDGILTAEEIAAMNLQGVEWAVLSACDTGLGEIRPGEGVLGLRRAFQIAGVQTVIMSLWQVDDEAARRWMSALYEARFDKALGTANAVWQASLSELRQRRASGQSTHPFFWAAFVASGDWH